MAFIRMCLLGATLIAAFSADAQPTGTDERIRLENLRMAKTMIEAMDNMTPDEIAAVMGIPTGEEYAQWLQTDPDLLFTPSADSSPLVLIRVSIEQQRIWVAHPGGQFTSVISSGMHDFRPPSTGGYRSRRGCFRPHTLAQMHYSKKYNMAPMPNSLFYYEGYAIHATDEVHRLGKPASHGCVRVSLATSQAIYDVVSRYGRRNTQVCVCWNNCSAEGF